MAVSDLSNLSRVRNLELRGTAASSLVAIMIAVLFAGSTMLTPLYVIYQQQFGFSQITLTLIYSVYVVGNLASLLLFGRLSDQAGRRRTALPAIAVAILSALVFLFAQGTAALYVGRILNGLAIGVGAGTGTAWLAELIGGKDKARAASLATSSNFAGLGLGALIAGVLAQYAPWPLHLSFLVYLLVLLVTAALIWLTQETVRGGVPFVDKMSWRPRLSVPQEIRAQFVAPAVAGFGAMALVGFYASIAPSLLADRLHETSHALAGALFFELSVVVAGTILATQRLASRASMLSALVLMVPSVLLVVAAQVLASMPMILIATAVCGVAAGLGYRGSLQVVNEIAPADRRAEVVSSYFISVFAGNALPVIGIGLIATLSTPIVANLVFAAMIIAFAVVALCFGAKYKH